MPTPNQLRLIHIAAKQVGLDDAGYRLVLRSSGKVESSKDLSQSAFEDCMVTLEEMGYRDPKHPGGGDYWRNKVEQRGCFANSRMVQMIDRLARQQRYCLPALCEQFSAGRVQVADRLTPQEAWKLIEMLKSAVARESRDASDSERPPPPPPPPAATNNGQRTTDHQQLFPENGVSHAHLSNDRRAAAAPVAVAVSEEERQRHAERDRIADEIGVLFF